MHDFPSAHLLHADILEARGTGPHNFYTHLVIPWVVFTAILAWLARPSVSEAVPSGFRAFQCRYLAVWVLCVAADWLQGPYVYSLYQQYDFSRQAISELFVCGFGSSLLFSVFVGAVCDRFGRKRCALLYCGLYIASCVSKHFRSFWVLVAGRVLAGMATALLFSCFECWMVSEHTQRHKFPSGLLAYMFGMMFTVMYLVAIACGFLGDLVAGSAKLACGTSAPFLCWGGSLLPFDAAIVALVLGALVMAWQWDENYGSQDEVKQQGVIDNLRGAFRLFHDDPRAWLLGCMVASFEGAMYIFVFNWTPILDVESEPVPLGLIFSLFMMACMSGASAITVLGTVVPPAPSLAVIFTASSGLLLAVACFAGSRPRICFWSFAAFEIFVGAYFPSIGVLKSEVIPESIRGTVYHMYRVPLNAIVMIVVMSKWSMASVFVACAGLLLLGGVCALLVLALTWRRRSRELGKAKAGV